MPSYDFKCNNCNKTLTVVKKMSDNDPTMCTHCKTEGKLEQIISSAAPVFYQGGNWFKTTGKY